MREIKFRAFIKKIKWMVPVAMIDFTYSTVEVDLSYGNGATSEYDFNEVELMQFTGILDKHNKRVYEGDIIRVFDPDKKHQIQQVVFQDGAFCGYSPKKSTRWTLLDILVGAHGVEVIGNVHENEDLLEGK